MDNSIRRCNGGMEMWMDGEQVCVRDARSGQIITFHVGFSEWVLSTCDALILHWKIERAVNEAVSRLNRQPTSEK